MKIYLAEIVAYNPALPGTETLRFCSGRGYNHPSAPGFYTPQILQPATLERNAFSSGTTFGAVETGYGALTLSNNDGSLDALIDYGFDGRAITIKIGEQDADYSTFTTLFVGTLEQATFSISTIEFLLRDRLFEFDKPLQTNKFGGTNVPPAGVDGEEELKGKPIPIVYGIVRGVEPILVNAARNIYQVGHAAVNSVTVTDSGITLTAGAAYTNLADMQANQPTPGQFRFLSTATGSYIRLGRVAAGGIRVTITQGANSAARTTAQILKNIAVDFGGISAGDVDSGDVTDLDTACNFETGIWLSEETTAREAMRQVAQSAGAWFGFDRLGKLRMKQFVAPAGTPVATLKKLTKTETATATTLDIVSIEKLPSADSGNGVPIWRAKLKFKRTFSPQNADSLAATVSASLVASLSQEWRTVISDDASVKTKHLQAGELEFETLLVADAAALSEVARRLALYKVRRDRFKVKVALDNSTTNLIDLGDVVNVVLSRFGFSSGKLFVVTGISLNAARQILELDLWG